jgi:hypothetical protein
MEALIGEETEGGEEGDAIMVLYFTLKGKVEGRKTRGGVGRRPDVLRLRSRGGSGGWGRRRQAGPGCQRDKIEGRGSWADVC